MQAEKSPKHSWTARDAFPKLDLFYARFMDDWVILAPTRWKLRRAVKRVNEILNE